MKSIALTLSLAFLAAVVAATSAPAQMSAPFDEPGKPIVRDCVPIPGGLRCK